MSERDIFIAAMQQEDPAQRQAYLDEACARQPELRQQVENLLRLHAGAGSFLESPAAAAPATGAFQDAAEQAASREAPGALIGPYKLMEQIGEGGMGLVFVAEQQQPVRRKVAVKLIKPGLDTRAVVARFEAERQALALMDHPNIAKVFDGGETAGGRPFFVMELVKGVPITQFCDDNRLTPRERLGLFASVCQAVQHAHQKGIIHRDLKPSNVLVTSHDGTPVVKVIDFGVAKATGPRLTDKTVYTQLTQMVGTPLYMSPEQAGQSGLDVDTRADVYALGVLLYELLTGTTPFDSERLQKADYDELRRIIREEEPARPSTRLSTLGQAANTVSSNRRSDPKRLSQLVRGELDWIVMKALEKDRNRRYDTASAFAADVQRYLKDEPVQAGPPRAGYRLRKFLKRHRGPVLAATVILLALVAGIVGTTAGLLESWRQWDLAEQARKDQAKLLLETEWGLYASQINLAQQAWDSNNAALAFHHLESCRRDFRGWEYDYLFTLFYSNQRTYGNQHSLREELKAVSIVAYSPDGKRIVGGGDDGTVKVWDADTGEIALRIRGYADVVKSVAWSPDGTRILSGSADHTVKVWDAVWDVAVGQGTRTLIWGRGSVCSVAWSPDGKRFVCGSSSSPVMEVWDATTGDFALNLLGHKGSVGSVAWSPDGKRLVSGNGDRTVKVWDAATGQETLTLRGHTDAVSGVAFSPDGKRLVSGSWDWTVRVWDADTGEETLPLQGHTHAVTSVAWSPDGTRLVSGSSDQTVKVWDAATGQETLTLRGHTGPIRSLAWSPDGQRIVSGSEDKTVKVWDAATGREARTLQGHGGSVYSVAVSPDGQRLVSGSEDKTVKVWDAATGYETLTLKGHTGLIGCVAFSPDGKRIVSGSFDGTVKVWDASLSRQQP